MLLFLPEPRQSGLLVKHFRIWRGSGTTVISALPSVHFDDARLRVCRLLSCDLICQWARRYLELETNQHRASVVSPNSKGLYGAETRVIQFQLRTYPDTQTAKCGYLVSVHPKTCRGLTLGFPVN